MGTFGSVLSPEAHGLMSFEGDEEQPSTTFILGARDIFCFGNV